MFSSLVHQVQLQSVYAPDLKFVFLILSLIVVSSVLVLLGRVALSWKQNCYIVRTRAQ